MLAAISCAMLLIMQTTLLNIGNCIILLFDGENITQFVDQPLFHWLIPGSTCQPDHLVLLQSYRPEMQAGRLSKASLCVLWFWIQFLRFWTQFLHQQLTLPLSVPIEKAKNVLYRLIKNLLNWES